MNWERRHPAGTSGEKLRFRLLGEAQIMSRLEAGAPSNQAVAAAFVAALCACCSR